MPSDPDGYRSLVAALQDWGIRYLAPSDAKSDSSPSSPAGLIARLAEHPHPRLRMALVPLFILHPELVNTLPDLSLSPTGWETLKEKYTAAACLQRMWSIRLSLYLGKQGLLPDLYSAELDLPPVDEYYGKLCLQALAERGEFNQWPAYESVMDLLFAQLRLEARDASAPAS